MRIVWMGLDVLVEVAWTIEGDSSLPGGTRKLQEIEDYVVYSPDGDELNNYLTGEAHRDIVRMIAETMYDEA